jgi:NADH:ubiquinone oxidoreductase subunit H
MDVAKIGWLQTATNAVVILLCFLAAILALVWLDRRLHRRAKVEKA